MVAMAGSLFVLLICDARTGVVEKAQSEWRTFISSWLLRVVTVFSLTFRSDIYTMAPTVPKQAQLLSLAE